MIFFFFFIFLSVILPQDNLYLHRFFKPRKLNSSQNGYFDPYQLLKKTSSSLEREDGNRQQLKYQTEAKLLILGNYQLTTSGKKSISLSTQVKKIITKIKIRGNIIQRLRQTGQTNNLVQYLHYPWPDLKASRSEVKSKDSQT